MKIEVIGGSNAFDTDNSSFLVTLKGVENLYSKEKEDVAILIDCPNNAFEFIRDKKRN